MATNDGGRGTHQPAVEAVAKFERDLKGSIGLAKGFFRGLLDRANAVAAEFEPALQEPERKTIPAKVVSQKSGTIVVVPVGQPPARRK